MGDLTTSCLLRPTWKNSCCGQDESLGLNIQIRKQGGVNGMLHGVLRENTRKERPAARRQGSVTSDEHYRAIWGRTSASRTAHLNARPDVPRRSRQSRRRRPCHADQPCHADHADLGADGRATQIPAPTAVSRRSRRRRPGCADPGANGRATPMPAPTVVPRRSRRGAGRRCYLSRFLNNPTEPMLKAAEQIWRYLRTSADTRFLQ